MELMREISPDLAALMQAAIRAGEKAVANAMREAGTVRAPARGRRGAATRSGARPAPKAATA